MERVSSEDVKKLLKAKQETKFINEINQLKKDEALKVLNSEWDRKTPPYQYYKQRPENNLVQVKTFTDYFLIIKL